MAPRNRHPNSCYPLALHHEMQLYGCYWCWYDDISRCSYPWTQIPVGTLAQCCSSFSFPVLLNHSLRCPGSQFYHGRLKLDFESQSCTTPVETREFGILSLCRLQCYLHHRQRKYQISFWCLCPIFFPLCPD